MPPDEVARGLRHRRFVERRTDAPGMIAFEDERGVTGSRSGSDNGALWRRKTRVEGFRHLLACHDRYRRGFQVEVDGCFSTVSAGHALARSICATWPSA